MDERLTATIRYAKEELAEIEDLIDRGKLTEKGAFVRMFCLGKVLVGWEDEGTEMEQFQYLTRANQTVQEVLDNVARARAS